MKSAILESNAQKIRSLLEVNPLSVNDSLTEQGSTGVMVASSIGNLPILKLLVEEYSADINLRNQNGTSALVFACNTNQLEIVSYLCDRGADINCVIESGDTPLTIASSNGYDDIIRTLSNSQHAIVDYLHQNSEGKTALLCAIEHGHSSTVSTLISSEPDQASINFISEVSSMSVSPLVLASLYGETEIVRILLSHQADHSLISDRIICSQKSPKYDIEDIEEEEVSDTQLYFNQEEIQLRRQLIRSELLRARWLPRLDVRRCCELDDVNSLQSLLKEYHHSPEVLSLLTIETVSSSGNATALMVACLHGSVKVVEEILTLAASYPSHFNVRCTTPDGRNALFYAVWNGHSTLLRYLLDHENGLSDLVNVLNHNQESPLYFACTNGHPDCVSLLLQRGAEIQQDKIRDEVICSTPISHGTPQSVSSSESFPDLLESRREKILRLLGR